DCPDACLGWLGGRAEAPVLFVCDGTPERVARALAEGVWQWLPRSLVREHPAVLDAALRHAALRRATLPQVRRGDDRPRARRAQATRLANLLWAATPEEGRPRWSSQRHMLERLDEEVSRSRRHGTPLAVVLGEVWAEEGDEETPPGPVEVSRWAAERIE